MSTVDPLPIIQPAAAAVRDPVSGRTVWEAGMVRNATLDAQGALRFEIWFTPDHAKADRRGIEEAIEANLRGRGFEGPVTALAKLATPPPERVAPQAPKKPIPGVSTWSPGQKKAGAAPGQAPPQGDKLTAKPTDGGKVPGMGTQAMAPHGGPIVKKTLPGVRHLIAVASGKGGVGKSTVSTNLAVALRRQGFRVGLMDADIYGPSLPTMMNVHSRPLADKDRKILPVNAYGVRCLSIGMLVPADEAIIWRGPMIMGALRQFLQDTRWGDLDYLVIDLPPGTGDAQLSLIQSVDLSGAVIVTTPQKVALDDAVRGIAMFRKLGVPLLGLVENMAWYELPDGTRDHVFGEGGGVATAHQHGTEVLGQVPLQSSLRQSGDDGDPVALRDGPLGEIFAAIASRVAEQLPVRPVAEA